MGGNDRHHRHDVSQMVKAEQSGAELRALAPFPEVQAPFERIKYDTGPQQAVYPTPFCIRQVEWEEDNAYESDHEHDLARGLGKSNDSLKRRLGHKACRQSIRITNR